MALVPPIVISLFYVNFVVLLADVKAKWEKWAKIPVNAPSGGWGLVT